MADWSWNEARIERLTKLWADGLTASQVSAELSMVCAKGEVGPTRSAILGKVHRLNLQRGQRKLKASPSKPKTIASPSIAPAAPAALKPPKKSAFPETPRAKNQFDIAARAAITASEPGLPAKYETKPTGTGISIRELADGNCHWPLGDPRDANFEFCGKPAARKNSTGRSRTKSDEFAPYCLGHCLIAYRPPEERKRPVDEDAYLPARARASR